MGPEWGYRLISHTFSAPLLIQWYWSESNRELCPNPFPPVWKSWFIPSSSSPGSLHLAPNKPSLIGPVTLFYSGICQASNWANEQSREPTMALQRIWNMKKGASRLSCHSSSLIPICPQLQIFRIRLASSWGTFLMAVEMENSGQIKDMFQSSQHVLLAVQR